MFLVGWIRNFQAELKVQMKENLVLVVFSLLCFGLVYAVAAQLNITFDTSVLPYLKRAIVSHTAEIIMIMGLITVVRVMVVERPKDLTGSLLKATLPPLVDYRRYARMVPLLIFAIFGFFAFVSFKAMIPELIPFYADDLFSNMDRVLHFGRLPHEWLAPLLNSEWIVEKLDFIYRLWYFPMFLLWCWAAWGAQDDGWRRQYVLAFIMCWIIGGTVLATLLASVGPCFYDVIVNPDSPYQAQMALLNAYNENSPLMAVSIQETLLNGYLNSEGGMKIGISAMPSLHNCLSLLFVFAGYRINKYFGHVLVLFMILIFIGSIVLGWHYAVDAYLGFAVAWFCWKAAGYLLVKQDKFVAQLESTKALPKSA